MEPSETTIRRIVYFFGLVWIETTDGSFYFRRLSEGETVSAVSEHYRKAGKIDGKCQFYTDAKREEPECQATD